MKAPNYESFTQFINFIHFRSYVFAAFPTKLISSWKVLDSHHFTLNNSNSLLILLHIHTYTHKNTSLARASTKMNIQFHFKIKKTLGFLTSTKICILYLNTKAVADHEKSEIMKPCNIIHIKRLHGNNKMRDVLNVQIISFQQNYLGRLYR